MSRDTFVITLYSVNISYCKAYRVPIINVTVTSILCYHCLVWLQYEDDSPDDAVNIYSSQFPVHAVMCVIYTQFLVHHLNHMFVSSSADVDSVSVSVLSMLLDVYHWGRLVQSFAVCAAYQYMLKRKQQDYSWFWLRLTCVYFRHSDSRCHSVIPPCQSLPICCCAFCVLICWH